MYTFEFVKPMTVADAAKALAGGEAQALGGGQTLIPTLKARLADPGTLVSLANIDEMKYVRQGDGTVEIGGGTTHAMVAAAVADIYPGLADLAGRIGDPSVRNRGTIGGSLANNDPSACYPAAALGSGATIITDRREIAADDFFEGMFETALDEGEIVTGVRFPIPQAARYEKMPQPASRFPLVAVYVARYADAVRVAVTGASNNGVFRWTAAEDALSASFSADAGAGLSHPSGDMIADIHGTAEDRAHLIGVMTKRAVAAIA